MTPQMGAYTKADADADIAAHAADLDAHIRSSMEVMRTGEYLAFSGVTSGTMALVANMLYAQPFWVPRAITVDRIAINVTTFAANKKARIGIYNDGTNLYPGTRLNAGGEVSVASNGVKAVTINQALTKGIYWLALVSDGTPTIKTNRLHLVPLGAYSISLSTQNAGWSVAFVYAALPDPFTAGGSLLNETCPTITLRLLSLD